MDRLLSYIKRLPFIQIPLYSIPMFWSFYHFPRETFMLGTSLYIFKSVNDETKRREENKDNKSILESDEEHEESSDDETSDDEIEKTVENVVTNVVGTVVPDTNVSNTVVSDTVISNTVVPDTNVSNTVVSNTTDIELETITPFVSEEVLLPDIAEQKGINSTVSESITPEEVKEKVCVKSDSSGSELKSLETENNDDIDDISELSSLGDLSVSTNESNSGWFGGWFATKAKQE